MTFGNIKLWFGYRGKNIEIFYCPPGSAGGFKEKGVITNFVGGVGDNGVFIELDTGVLINTRYIVKITILD